MRRSFVLCFTGTIKYEGRAIGLLGPGKFLLLRKNDGSVSIHGGSKITPRNYMGSGTKMRFDIKNNQGSMHFERKKESISINISNIEFIKPIDDWSESDVQMHRTEKELVDKIFNNWSNYIDGEYDIIEREYPTIYGPIDLIGFGQTTAIIEVKRRKGSIPDCVQLRKYIETFENINVIGYLASPDIGDTALQYLDKHGFKWIQVKFDELYAIN